MREIRFILTLLFCSFGLGAVHAPGQTLNAQFSPVEQLLVLKNGEVMQGRISRNADQVILQTEQGSRLILASEKTEFTCNTMDEAYWGRLARTKASDVEGQKRLFHWCLKQKLLTQAQNQIDILLQADVKATELEYLDRQLNVALLQQRNSEQGSAVPSVPPTRQQAIVSNQDVHQKKSVPVDSSLAFSKIPFNDSNGLGRPDLSQVDDSVFRPLPSMLPSPTDSPPREFAQLQPDGKASEPMRSDSAVQQVGFEEEVVFDTIGLDHKLTNSGPSLNSNQAIMPLSDQVMISVHELDQETRSMPPGSLRLYRQRVERVLTNGCSAAKCHDSDSHVMPLMQLSRGQAIPRRQSQRNLHNVLKYVNRANPLESRLLLAATLPHAGQEDPILEKQSPHYDNLLKWLILMSDDPQESLFQAIQAERKALGGVPDRTEPVSIQPIKPEPDSVMVPTETTLLEFPTTVGEIPKLDAVDKGFKPIDPFDPEIFNRQNGK